MTLLAKQAVVLGTMGIVTINAVPGIYLFGMLTQTILVMAIKANPATLPDQVFCAIRPVKIIMTYDAFAHRHGAVNPGLGIHPVVAPVAQCTLCIPEFVGHVLNLKIAIPAIVCTFVGFSEVSRALRGCPRR